MSTKKKSPRVRYRYLTKDEVSNPIRYIKSHYENSDQEMWQEQVYVFLTSGSTYDRPPLRNPYNVYKHLVNHIDIAYLLLKSNRLESSAYKLIKSMFELNNRDIWIALIDDLLRNKIDTDYTFNRDHYTPILTNIVEHIHYLIRYFYLVYKGMPERFRLPLYILKYHSLGEEEQKLAQEFACVPPGRITEQIAPFFHKERVTLPEWLAPQPYSLKAVQDFFSIDDLKGWKNQLQYWYESVITPDLYWSADKRLYSGADLLHNYACIYSLLEMYQFQTPGLTTNPDTFNDRNSQPIFEEQQTTCVMHGKSSVSLYYATPEEMEAPKESIVSLVNTYSKAKWEEILYNWLSSGLSKHSFIVEEDNTHPSHVYQLLSKIIELNYVLAYQDELQYPISTD